MASPAGEPLNHECYRILNVSPGSGWDEIKKSYRSLARSCHPDLHSGDSSSEARFKEITRAYETLASHHQPHSVYNPWRFVSRPGSGETGADPPARGRLAEKLLRRLAPEIRQKLVGGMDRIFRILRQLEKKIFPLDVSRSVTVNPTAGSREGTLKVQTESESFSVRVPFENWNSIHLRIPQKGERGFIKNNRGDLLLNIQILPARRVDPERKNFNYKIQVPRESIHKGKGMTLQTHEGPIKFFLPKNTADHQTFVLRARSVPPSGNHIVEVHLV